MPSLNRLSRNLALHRYAMESGLEFVAVDNPHANKLTVHILAAVAQHEREMISERTKGSITGGEGEGDKAGQPKTAEARRSGALRPLRPMPISSQPRPIEDVRRRGLARAERPGC